MFYFHGFKDNLWQYISQPVINHARRNPLSTELARIQTVRMVYTNNSLILKFSVCCAICSHPVSRPLLGPSEGQEARGEGPGSLLLPHAQQVLPAALSKCPSEISLATG